MDGIKPIRRIVTAENEKGEPVVLSDGSTPDVYTDPARPGYSSARVWVTDQTPARIKDIDALVRIPHSIKPPKNGSLCRIVTFPPDASFINSAGAKEVKAYFKAMGAPEASTYSDDAPHPYRQKTESLDFCIVLEGEITLILDTQEVHLEKGDIVVQRGTNHAWSNRSDKPCVMVFSQHGGRFAR